MESRRKFSDELDFESEDFESPNSLFDNVEALIEDDEEDDDYAYGLGEVSEDTEFYQLPDVSGTFEVDSEDV